MQVLKSLFHMFGGLILYWVAFFTFGVKAAIAAALVFIVIEGSWRLVTRRPFPPLWLVVNSVAVIFGVVDLRAATPFMIRYESSITNLLFAAIFAAGAVGSEPLIMKFARQGGRLDEEELQSPELIRFFRFFTLAWATFYVFRSMAFLWIMSSYPLTEGLIIRKIVSLVSFGVMILISLQGERVFRMCQAAGFLQSKGA
ncbi:septation protein IspZ [Acetobacter sp. AN02]|uniref:septation protein IspZ n=1 Tax=Acetobacter sp. AN02 TaxID=2894186 RepID=UPI0024345892|nr:septation protein IspZ [Acetobacter sp. AN02]MDG6094718.1 septation protein IspZ [Acetobacter sp. AN02]